MDRRSFLTTTARSSLLATLAATSLPLQLTPQALAADPFNRPGKPRLRLGLAAYSFRNYLRDTNHPRDKETDPNRRIDLFKFLDYCADNGCEGAELTSYYFPTKLDPDYLLRIRRHAFLRGVAISGTAVGNTFTYPKGDKLSREIANVKQWIDRAQILGAPHIRVFAGPPQGRNPADATKDCIEALQETCDYAGSKGIFLGLENHGGIVAEADALLNIVRSINSPWLGINLDTGNFQTADPYADLAKCAPYAVNVQIKLEIQAKGKRKEPADLQKLVSILRTANYQGFVTLEYESPEDPYLAVPGALQTLRSLMTA